MGLVKCMQWMTRWRMPQNVAADDGAKTFVVERAAVVWQHWRFGEWCERRRCRRRERNPRLPKNRGWRRMPRFRRPMLNRDSTVPVQSELVADDAVAVAVAPMMMAIEAERESDGVTDAESGVSESPRPMRGR